MAAKRKQKTKENSRSYNTKQQKIIVFDVEAQVMDKSGAIVEAGGLKDKILKVIGLKPTELTIEMVENNMNQFVSNMQQIIDRSSKNIGNYNIDAVEVDARISADGQIGLMGTHVGMSGEAGIKFIFKRS
jgi:hypothetical protein